MVNELSPLSKVNDSDSASLGLRKSTTRKPKSAASRSGPAGIRARIGVFCQSVTVPVPGSTSHWY
eukprot:6711835-Prymnesium_polylepis.2